MQKRDGAAWLRQYWQRIGPWRLFAIAVGVVMFGPIMVTIISWVNPEYEIWNHLANTLLPQILRNTAILIFGVGFAVMFIGVGLAWLTAVCEFPGRKFFDWALMLPLAVPAYVLAFVFVGFFEYSGPLQTSLRDIFGPEFQLPPVRSAPGVVLVMALVFYPYVYMLTRAAFLAQGRTPLEAARIQGLGPWAAFGRVALPMARPAIAAGTALALMETLADFGAVSIFNFQTFTTAIYRAWFGFYSIEAAAQLAAILLLIVLTGLWIERRARGRARFDQGATTRYVERIYLRGWRRWAATAAASTVLLLGFVLPMIQLLIWAASEIDSFDPAYFGIIRNTVTLGAIAAVLTVLIALLLAYARRVQPDTITRRAVTASTLGYALPGSVLAVGIMLTLTWIDHSLAALIEPWGGLGTTFLAGSVGALILAYVIRFMAVAFGAVDSSFERIRPELRDAARSLGATEREVIKRVYVPILTPGLLTALLLVGVDVMKEMPATLLLRPFGWDTLAIRIFEMTFEGQWERAALPAITLVIVGLLPVILLVRGSARAT
ncbi:ferric iron ABC transporter [Halorhodospira halochloris]|uniref:Ferric iron ABC transporter n=1 Tax=Halorhodospira halochloris TaxID=1052 RepID=A0A0X8X6Y3_HALHR|nr:iron ABC transporter permease [Halorhodospira halochloris]MBK1650796.1 ABC transporter permease [Halorhodospira halochloris]BAU56706.1 ferric iron ABC transporter [Halorhodospira halochloris]